MSLFDGIVIIAVLLLVGFLLVLGARLRTEKNTVMLLLIIGVLVLGLMSLSKLVTSLFGAVLLLALIVGVLIMLKLRH